MELGRSFVGGIAIALSVPLTTAIAAALTSPAGVVTTEHEPAPAAPGEGMLPGRTDRAGDVTRRWPTSYEDAARSVGRKCAVHDVTTLVLLDQPEPRQLRTPLAEVVRLLPGADTPTE